MCHFAERVYTVKTGVAAIINNIIRAIIFLIPGFMSFMALYTNAEYNSFYYFFLILPSLYCLVYLYIILEELIWLVTQKPIADFTENGIYIYKLNKKEFHSWDQVRKYKFKRNKLVRGAGYVEFIDKPGNILFEFDISRAKWHRTVVREHLSQYAKYINDRNNPWG